MAAVRRLEASRFDPRTLGETVLELSARPDGYELLVSLALRIVEAQRRESVRPGRSARVRAAIQRSGRDWRLVVANEGTVTARNVKVELDGGPLLAHTLVPSGQDEVKKLGPGALARYLLAPTMGSPTIVEARVTWDDDSGEGRSWESQLTL